MKIDLHVHAKERSECSQAGEEEMIQAAIKAGLQGLFFTDHQCLVPVDRLQQLNDKYKPFRVFGGIEVRTREGEDVLVYGIHDPALEKKDWSYAALHAFVRGKDGFMTLAHPFRSRPTLGVDVDNYKPDAIEIRSINIPPEKEGKIRLLVSIILSNGIYSSDAHSIDCVGTHYIKMAQPPADEKDLLRLLKSRKYTCESVKTGAPPGGKPPPATAGKPAAKPGVR